MKIDPNKLDLVLSRRCMNLSDLRTEASSQTLRRIRQASEVKPATLGRIAKALGVDPAELLKEEL